MTWMPPQHGKSELISRYFPVWYLGQNPNDRVILSSYEAGFAADWGRKSRDVFKEWAGPIFGLSLREDSSSVKHWDISGFDGGMDTSGAGGSQTGKKADFFDIDDPHKNPQEARSKIFQQRIYDWYLEAVDTRLSEQGLISITQTRWDTRDLSGRILFDDQGRENEPHVVLNRELLESFREGKRLSKDKWVILHLPAIATKPDILNRKKGQALCVNLFSLETLLAKQRRMGNRSFSALYQGEPVPLEGNVFKREWFYTEDNHLRKILFTSRNFLPSEQNQIRYWDFASSGEGGDYAAGLKSSYLEDNLIVNDLVYDQFSADAMLNTYIKTTRKDTIRVRSIIEQEPASMSIMLIAKFRQDKRLKGYAIMEDKVTDSKLDRCFDLELLAETDRLRFNTATMPLEKIYAIVDMLLAFTGEKEEEDHVVDALSGSARYWLNRSGESDYTRSKKKYKYADKNNKEHKKYETNRHERVFSSW